MVETLEMSEIKAMYSLVHGSDSSKSEDIEHALTTLEKHGGDVEASFQSLWKEEVGVLGVPSSPDKSLWQTTINVMQQEICGDEGFRRRLLDYNKNPSSAPLLTGAIVYLAGLTTLPINPAIATIVVLYILKVGLNIFCEYVQQ